MYTFNFSALLIALFVVAIAVGVFEIAMLIHCLKSKDPEKIVWVLVIIFLTPIGAFIYWAMKVQTTETDEQKIYRRHFSESFPVALRWLLTTVGGVIGAVIGYYIFQFMWRKGYYGPPIVGLMVGLGCWLLGGRGTWVNAVISTAIALLGMYVCEAWRYLATDFDAIMNFLPKLLKMRDLPIKLLLYALGGVVAFFLAWGGIGKPNASAKSKR